MNEKGSKKQSSMDIQTNITVTEKVLKAIEQLDEKFDHLVNLLNDLIFNEEQEEDDDIDDQIRVK